MTWNVIKHWWKQVQPWHSEFCTVFVLENKIHINYKYKCYMWTLNMSIKKSERSDSSSLQLLWYIGGTPPVLRNGTKFVGPYQEKIFGTKNSSSLKRRRRTVSSLASSFYFTILASLCLFISPCQANQSCHRF